MWLKLFVDDYHLNNIVEVKNNHIGENKNLQFFKNWTHVLCNENNFVK
jgi:hypothetical protein